MTKLSKQLPHADVIKHMSDNGFESVEYRNTPIEAWTKACAIMNPVLNLKLTWRIKPVVTPLEIDDFPYPEVIPPNFREEYYLLFSESVFEWLGDTNDLSFFRKGLVYLNREKRDKANELLIAALLQKEKS